MEQQFICSGDCLKCHPGQRQYCAAQFTYNSMRMIEQMQATLSVIQDTITEMKTKIEAIQNSEAEIFDPTKDEIAQSGDGAEE